MNKKKIITLAIAVILIVATVAGASYAYLTDTKTADNTFTMGNVRITLDETDVKNPDGDRVTSNEYGIGDVYPGAVMKKDPIVHNVGKNPAYIRATVVIENGMNWLGLYNENVWTAPLEPAFNALINNSLGEGWELADYYWDMSGPNHPTSDFVAILKYTGTLAAGEDTTPMFSEIKIADKITENDVTTRIAQNGEFSINVTADAIQANGFDTWEDAFAAFDAQ